MNRTGRIILLSLILALAIVPVLFAGEHGTHSTEESAHHDRESNPLIEEMVKLDGVFREVVSGVSLGDGERVHKALETMHGTMEKTHEGVHDGHVTIPKNAHRIEEFVKMDIEFHERLEHLAHAAHEGDQEQMLSITQSLLQGCVQCHTTFR